jgi:hypothetical protein
VEQQVALVWEELLIILEVVEQVDTEPLFQVLDVTQVLFQLQFKDTRLQ